MERCGLLLSSGDTLELDSNTVLTLGREHAASSAGAVHISRHATDQSLHIQFGLLLDKVLITPFLPGPSVR